MTMSRSDGKRKSKNKKHVHKSDNFDATVELFNLFTMVLFGICDRCWSVEVGMPVGGTKKFVQNEIFINKPDTVLNFNFI